MKQKLSEYRMSSYLILQTNHHNQVSDGTSYPTVTRSYQVDTCNKLQVDTDIVRGITLARTLQRNGWLWKTSPIDMEAVLVDRWVTLR